MPLKKHVSATKNMPLQPVRTPFRSTSPGEVGILVVMVAATWSCVEGELNFSRLAWGTRLSQGLAWGNVSSC